LGLFGQHFGQHFFGLVDAETGSEFPALRLIRIPISRRR
jgi:hypothetical protein